MAARDHFRAHERRRIDLAATLHLPDAPPSLGSDDEDVRQDVRIRDLGFGGAGIEVPDEPVRLPDDGPVLLEVMVPVRWDPLVLRGKIVWIERGEQGRGMRAGVRFDHREPAAIYALFLLLIGKTLDA